MNLHNIFKYWFHQFTKLFIPCNCYDCILLEIEKHNLSISNDK